MTEQEAIMIIQAIPEKIWNQMDKTEEEAIKKAFKALEFQKTFTEKTDSDGVVIVIMQKGGTYEINGINVLEAVEKQNPKKVVNIDDFADYAECPSCGAIATDHLGCLYGWCRKCGQKLKRSE